MARSHTVAMALPASVLKPMLLEVDSTMLPGPSTPKSMPASVPLRRDRTPAGRQRPGLPDGPPASSSSSAAIARRRRSDRRAGVGQLHRERRRRGVAVAVRDRVGEGLVRARQRATCQSPRCRRRLPATIVTVPPRLPVGDGDDSANPGRPRHSCRCDSSPRNRPDRRRSTRCRQTDASCPSFTATGVSSSISTLIVPVARRASTSVTVAVTLKVLSSSGAAGRVLHRRQQRDRCSAPVADVGDLQREHV